MRLCTSALVTATAALACACTALSAPAAPSPPPTVTDTFNTCEGLPKLDDVAVARDCHNVRVTYATRVVLVGKAIASSRLATVAQKDGDVDGPLAIYVRAIAAGRQKRTVIWSLVCTKHGAAINGDDTVDLSSGSFDTRSVVRRQVRMPVEAPDSCTFDALAATDGGTLRLRVLARVRAGIIKREVLS